MSSAALAIAPPRNVAERIADMPPAERRSFLSTLSPRQLLTLKYDWHRTWARLEQLTPLGQWFLWMINCGRGWGKTRTGAETIRDWAEQASLHRRVERYALVGQTKADVRDVMVEGISGILAISPPWYRPLYEPSKRLLTWPNGTYALLFSGDEPDQMRGPQFDKAWADEPAKWRYAEEAWDNLEFGLRIGRMPQVVATTTPRPIPLIKKLLADPDAVVTRGTTYANRTNLSQRYIERVVRKYEGTRLGRQELLAEMLDEIPGALWALGLIEKHRRGPHQIPSFVRIVVAVDPAGGSEEYNNETGIIVAAKGTDGHAYLLTDASGNMTPAGWGAVAVEHYKKRNADRIVGEKNNGGKMVEHTIRTVDPNASYKAVWASKGKVARAEPVAALMEQGKVHHVGMFPELEDQMANTTVDEYLGKGSPDRMDAYVWAISELMLEEAEWGTVRTKW